MPALPRPAKPLLLLPDGDGFLLLLLLLLLLPDGDGFLGKKGMG